MSETSLEINNKNISCKNCGTQYTGNYCPECGQSSKSFDKPFRFLIADFAGNIFAFDTRLWSTIKAVLIHPGQMTMDLMNGKRARYVPPFRLYVFVSFIFFLLINFTVSNVRDGQEPVLQQEIVEGYSNDTTGLSELPIEENKKQEIIFSDKKVTFAHVVDHFEMYFSRFLQWFSYSLFLLMPFYAFLLWVFFRKTYKYYLGHLILALNQHVFTFILLTVIVLIGQILPFKTMYPEAYMLWLLPIYYVLGIRKMYQRKWSTTIMRFSVVLILYLTSTLSMVLGLMVYTLYALS